MIVTPAFCFLPSAFCLLPSQTELEVTMILLGVLCSFLFLALGVYGGMSAYSRWVRTDQGHWVFEPLLAMYFGLALLAALFGVIAGVRVTDGSLQLLEFALLPFGMLGAVLWVFGLGLETGARMISPNMPPLARTFDVGDGYMARSAFADAEREF